MGLLAEGQAANALLLAGVALVCAVLLFRSQRRIRGQASSQPLPPSAWRPQSPTQPRLASAANPPPEAEDWQVEFHEMAREATAKLDNKIRILEHLIRDADARIARLQSVGEWLDRSAQLDVDSNAASGGSASQSPDADFGGNLANEPRGAASTTALFSGDDAFVSQPYGEIYALADAGHSSVKIASRLNRPIGEIELILGLRPKR